MIIHKEVREICSLNPDLGLAPRFCIVRMHGSPCRNLSLWNIYLSMVLSLASRFMNHIVVLCVTIRPDRKMSLCVAIHVAPHSSVSRPVMNVFVLMGHCASGARRVGSVPQFWVMSYTNVDLVLVWFRSKLANRDRKFTSTSQRRRKLDTPFLQDRKSDTIQFLCIGCRFRVNHCVRTLFLDHHIQRHRWKC